MYTPIGAHQPLKSLRQVAWPDVFLATDAKQSNGYCALKVLLPEVMNRPLVREHFEVEARLLESLDHPSIVRFVEYGSSNARPFFAMEYLHGVSGSELLVNAHKLKRPIPLGLAIGITKCIADALHYGSALRVKAGGKAIIHNDVSPHNFQLDFDGQIKLLDYGVALTGAGTNDSLRRGKFAYMSPEAIRKDTLDHPKRFIFSGRFVVRTGYNEACLSRRLPRDIHEAYFGGEFGSPNRTHCAFPTRTREDHPQMSRTKSGFTLPLWAGSLRRLGAICQQLPTRLKSKKSVAETFRLVRGTHFSQRTRTRRTP